jgi:tetratricopeptide (TPR) repeat protein
LSKAKKYLQEARTQFRKILDERNHFKFNNFNLELFHEILINLGIVYFKSKQFTLAEDSFNLVIDMAKSNSKIIDIIVL